MAGQDVDAEAVHGVAKVGGTMWMVLIARCEAVG